MKGKKASLIYCDPIFNIALDYSKGIGTKGKYGGKAKDKKTYEEYRQFLKSTIQNALMVANKDCHVFYYCDQNYIGLLQELYKELEIDPKRVCIWIKNNANPTPQIAFSKCYEPCVYGTVGNPYLSPLSTKLNEVMNKEVTTGNRVIDDIYDLIDIWLVKRLATTSYAHPTQKPVTLHEKPIKRCTTPGDVVLDLFSGSGSTLLACEQLNRVCYTIDIDPLFVDLTIRRYEKYSGQKAKKIN
jgi:DNA modification methylase